MTPQQFKDIWTSIDDNLSPLRYDKLVSLKLSKSTIEFLVISGLPKDAAPFISFCRDSNDKFDDINKLTTQYDFLDFEFEKYIVIGSCSDGDPIVINIENNDQIEWLDHDDLFPSMFFNSSINSLAECLVIYRDFILTVQKENGEDAYLNFNFTDMQFEKLKNDLILADNKISEEKGFWYEQLEMELTLRLDNLNKN